MEAMKTKQSEELQQHLHQMHATVSHADLSFRLATTHAHTVSHMAAYHTLANAHCLQD